MNKPAVLSLLLLLVLLCLLFFTNLSGIPLVIWDEARLANNALEMYQNGNWLVTHYDGAPDLYNTKPPLLIWLQVFCIKIFGINEFAIRLPSALASVSTGVLLWWFLKRQLADSWIGFLAGAVYCTTYAVVFLHAGRSGDYEALLTFFITAFAVCLYLFVTEKKIKWLYLFWLFLALAVLTKSITGLIFLPGLFLFALFKKSVMPTLFNKHFYIGACGFLLLAGGYYLWREQLNPGYLKAVWENELGGRFNAALEGHSRPFYYYFNNMYKWRNEYWFYFILPAFAVGFVMKEKEVRTLSLFNLLMVVPFFLLISKAQTKLQWYDVPLYPFLAVQIAVLLSFAWAWMERFFARQAVRSAVGVVALAAVFFVPLRQCWNFVTQYGKQPHKEDVHQQGYYLKRAMEKEENLNGFVFLYEGYGAHIKFYIDALRLKGSTVTLQEKPEGLEPGKNVVVSQPALTDSLHKLYVTQKLGEAFGCTVYRIKQRL